MSEPKEIEAVTDGRGESRTEYTSLTSTEGESGEETVTKIEILKLFDDNESELNPNTSTITSSQDAKSEAQEMGTSSSAARKYQIDRDETEESHEELEPNTDGDYCQDQEDDDTLSSEAFVDDIELILMPEGTEDLPDDRNSSPKLVRVTELRSHADDDDDDDDCDFRKMDASERSDRDLTPNANFGENSGDEYEYDEQDQEGAVGLTHSTSKSEVYISFEEDDQSFSHHSTGGGGQLRYKKDKKQKMHSGVQTDITALENDYKSQPYDFKSRKAFLGGSVKVVTSGSSGRTNTPVKKLNWKSELTLLPSKTKISYGYGPSYGALTRTSDDRDQYSSRVTKFTSQDNVQSCTSQFLKPSTLYRTRNLSRNLNHFGSSETTLVLPMTETTTSESTRYRDRIHSGVASGSQFKAQPNQSHHISYQTSYTPKSLLFSGTAAKNFRSSLPDLSSTGGIHLDNKRRQSQKSIRSSLLGTSSSGWFKGYKKSSSDDETSSLIDESERCLRSSIDLLLTDDLPSPGSDYPYRSGSFKGSFSARRTCSQPILTDQGYFGEPRNTLMGSPFLPRKLSDLRCSHFAKVILPNGQVSVVAVRETDECRDILTVQTDTGCLINLPFRKVVFAWRMKR